MFKGGQGFIQDFCWEVVDAVCIFSHTHFVDPYCLNEHADMRVYTSLHTGRCLVTC